MRGAQRRERRPGDPAREGKLLRGQGGVCVRPGRGKHLCRLGDQDAGPARRRQPDDGAPARRNGADPDRRERRPALGQGPGAAAAELIPRFSGSRRRETMSTFKTITRRRLLTTAGALGTAVALPTPFIKRAGAAEQITVADVGGAPAEALRKAFYDPFEKATGIRIENVAHESDPVTQFKVIVDSNSKIWDVCMVTPDDVVRLTEQKNYLEPLEITAGSADMVPGSLMPNWFGFSVYGIVMAYRTDTYKNGGPAN